MIVISWLHCEMMVLWRTLPKHTKGTVCLVKYSQQHKRSYLVLSSYYIISYLILSGLICLLLVSWGTASAFALEEAWWKSGDQRFHPIDARWVHPSFRLNTLEKFHAFHPRKFSLGLQLPASYRLWPPSFKAPSGRPRTRSRPFRKKQKSGLREVETFISRSSQQDQDEDIRTFTHPSTTFR